MIRGGKSYVSSIPTFSNDARKLLVCTGNTISIFSTSTGLQLTELEGHTALVTSVIVVPASTPASKILCYCWTASLDGTIRYWDFSVPELMKTIDIRLPIHSMVIPGLLGHLAVNDQKPPDLFAYLSTEDAKEQGKQPKATQGQIRKCNLTKSRLSGGMILGETCKPEFLTSSPSGKYMGLIDKRKLRIWEVPPKDSERVVYKKIRLHHTKSFTTLAFHPSEQIVAAGDITGRILIWRGFGNRTFSSSCISKNGNLMNDDDERPGVRGDDDANSCTTWHWHSAEVKALLFSSDGAYLYSGGREGVLVVWQLETGKKKFLPRIGSLISHFVLSPDPSLASICCADNRIHLLKMPSMGILKSISGIRLPCSAPDIYSGSCGGFVFDHAAGVVVTRTENYCIQFYSLFEDREISEVQVSERNHQPGDELTVIINSMAISLDGSMMITAETRLPEEGIGSLVALKFWARGSHNKEFSLSTIIYEPHRYAGVSGIAFHPSGHMAVSSSYGGDFKIWIHNHETQPRGQRLQSSGWTCHAVGSYKKKPMTAVAFSADGSVLAVAAETLITLWDPVANFLVAVIGGSLEPIEILSFVGKSEYLVSASRGSDPQLSIWSMSMLSVSWSYKLQTEAVACTMDDSSFAILAVLPKLSPCSKSNESTLQQDADGMILLFNVLDPVPVASWLVRKAKGGGLAFVPANAGYSETNKLDGKPVPMLLAYMNGDHEFVVFDPLREEALEHSINHHRSLISLEEKGQLGYTSIYGDLPEFDLKRNQTTPITTISATGRPWENIFSGPSHSLPSLSRLCSVFLESLLEKRTDILE